MVWGRNYFKFLEFQSYQLLHNNLSCSDWYILYWKLFNAFLQNSNMINPKASSWPVRFCIIWFLPPFQPHLPAVAPCLPVPTIMVFCLFLKHATLIPPRKTWHLLLSPSGIIFSQALSPEWIPILSDSTSLEGSSPTTVLKKPSHSFF